MSDASFGIVQAHKSELCLIWNGIINSSKKKLEIRIVCFQTSAAASRCLKLQTCNFPGFNSIQIQFNSKTCSKFLLTSALAVAVSFLYVDSPSWFDYRFGISFWPEWTQAGIVSLCLFCRTSESELSWLSYFRCSSLRVGIVKTHFLHFQVTHVRQRQVVWKNVTTHATWVGVG